MFWPPPSLEVAVTALVVETSMYMLHLVSQCASLYFLTKRNIASPKASRITPIFVVSVLLFALTTFAVLGDGFLAYRLYIVWGRSRGVLVPPLLLIGGFIAFGVLAMLGKPFPVIYFMFGSTAILNVFVSAMIVYKVWKMDMGAQPIGGPLSVTARVAQTLLESAGIYAPGRRDIILCYRCPCRFGADNGYKEYEGNPFNDSVSTWSVNENLAAGF
ncbi:hypothetical protein EYR36_010019 [Pleurotus pulmonarius]|nr:hypothetical protein EYR36_010019 [Pleurotus pulmonarius]